MGINYFSSFYNKLNKIIVIMIKSDSRQTFFIIPLKECVRCKDCLVMSSFSLISLFSDTGTKIG